MNEPVQGCPNCAPGYDCERGIYTPEAAPEPDARRILAALEELGWPDDRERSAHIEPDGHEVTPIGHYWSTMSDVLRAADVAADR